MTPILVFIVFPLVTVIFSIALEILLKKIWLVASVIFAVFLVAAFTIFTVDFVIATIIYFLLSLITGLIIKFCYVESNEICKLHSNNEKNIKRERSSNKEETIDFDIKEIESDNINRDNKSNRYARRKNLRIYDNSSSGRR
jgi:Protein of unknown function (DUF2651).